MMNMNMLCNIYLFFKYLFNLQIIQIIRIIIEITVLMQFVQMNNKISHICISFYPLLCKQSNCTSHCEDFGLFYNNIKLTSGTTCMYS